MGHFVSWAIEVFVLGIVGAFLNVPDEGGGDLARFVCIVSIPSLNYAIIPTVQGGLAGFCSGNGIVP